MFEKLKREDRLRLMRFVCSFVWADLEVQKKERDFVHGMVKRLKLDASEAKQVEKWLQVPPKPEEVDPASVPQEHRQLFLQAARDAITADGVVDDAERETFELLDQLLR